MSSGNLPSTDTHLACYMIINSIGIRSCNYRRFTEETGLTLWLTGARKEAKPTETRPVEP